MKKPKTIYCPSCNRKLGAHDGRTKTALIVNCRKCKKQIVYKPLGDSTEIKDIPQRNTASGMVFH